MRFLKTGKKILRTQHNTEEEANLTCDICLLCEKQHYHHHLVLKMTTVFYVPPELYVRCKQVEHTIISVISVYYFILQVPFCL